MKHYLLYLCAASLFFSCSKSDQTPPDEGADGKMHFAADIPAKEDDWSRATRGVVIDNTNIADFGVFCFHTERNEWEKVSTTSTPDKMFNIQVTRTPATNDWTYTPPVAWNGGDMSYFTFFGYAPYATPDNGITPPASAAVEGTPSLGFVVGDKVPEQLDLLVAKPVYNTTPVAKVRMQFAHALSCIGFKAYSQVKGITVSKIQITGVKYKGNLTLDGLWSSAPDITDFAITYNPAIEVPEEAIDIETAVNLSADPNGFFLLPQDLKSNATAKIIFTFILNNVELTKEYVIKQTWAKSKRITYTVDLTTNLEEPLDVTEVTITDWAMGTSESGDSDGKPKEVELTYNDNGTETKGEKGIQNEEVLISKSPTNPIEAWNTKPDGSGDYYGKGDMIILKGNTTLYAVDNTVTIGGMRWLRGNLSGTAGSDAGHYSEGNPSAYGMFFKWGSTFVYQRESSISDGGGWGDLTTGAATTPAASSTGGTGYDYVGLAGGLNPGDPCQKLGANYRTPTRAQWKALAAVGTSSWTTYQDIPGCFFGSNASSCNNSTIQPGCIFIPAFGYRKYSDGAQYKQGSGYYWSSSVYDANQGHYCYFGNGGVSPSSNYYRGNGFSVRCVSTDVNIGGVNWTTANLEGTAGTATGHKMAAAPQDYGNFFKWGSTFVYQRESSNSDGGGWGAATSGAATTPTTSSTGGTGYDYVGLAGGTNPGDPCLKLGANYKTPTRKQWQDLASYGVRNWASYQGIKGSFFGPNASSCNDSTIQPGCIFLPFSGDREYYLGALTLHGNVGFYWSSTAYDSKNCYNYTFMGGNPSTDSYDYRGYGFSVRCVRDETIK